MKSWLEEGPENATVEILGKIRSASNLVSEEGCNTCAKEYPLTFKNIPSFKEYKISGMCQSCQDEVFGRSTK
ncbi:MAG: hypothetical protein H8E55_45575 [Pelagibacterales bacterium]|nr:hypothetical protein [Pelagibacterales bacterium]|tara:strand:+ start:45 stop:260 length:216 start_codon:yes stop_codon:yes gene_type:complete